MHIRTHGQNTQYAYAIRNAHTHSRAKYAKRIRNTQTRSQTHNRLTGSIRNTHTHYAIHRPSHRQHGHHRSAVQIHNTQYANWVTDPLWDRQYALRNTQTGSQMFCGSHIHNTQYTNWVTALHSIRIYAFQYANLNTLRKPYYLRAVEDYQSAAFHM